MSTFKKLTEVCAVEIMVGLGFLITGVLCLAVSAYDGAAVCAVVVIVAGIIGRMQWKKAVASGPAAKTPDITDQPKRNRAKPQQSKPRRKPIKAKKPAKRTDVKRK